MRTQPKRCKRQSSSGLIAHSDESHVPVDVFFRLGHCSMEDRIGSDLIQAEPGRLQSIRTDSNPIQANTQQRAAALFRTGTSAIQSRIQIEWRNCLPSQWARLNIDQTVFVLERAQAVLICQLDCRWTRSTSKLSYRIGAPRQSAAH